jgi:hypothetical protein
MAGELNIPAASTPHINFDPERRELTISIAIPLDDLATFRDGLVRLQGMQNTKLRIILSGEDDS